jgi:hypothetical protein
LPTAVYTSCKPSTGNASPNAESVIAVNHQHRPASQDYRVSQGRNLNTGNCLISEAVATALNNTQFICIRPAVGYNHLAVR